MADLTIKLVMTADGTRLTRAVDAAGRKVGELGGKAQRAGDEASRGLGRARAGVESISRQLQSARKYVVSYFGAFMAIDAVGTLRRMADGWQSVRAQLMVATKSQADFGFALDEVYRIAQSTGAELESTGKLYARLATAIQEMGGNVQMASVVTQAMNDALKISKASTAEAASAQIQFSQAIASGVLRGEEFNAVNEAAPPLMKALAEQLGVTRGELRKMAEAGQLTADVVLPAIIKASGDLRETSERMGDTMAMSWQKVVNAMQRWVGEKDEAIGASRAISNALNAVANNFGLVGDAVLRLSTVAMVGYALKLGKAKTATLGLGGALTGARAKLLQFTVQTTRSMTAVKLMSGALKTLGLAARAVFPIFIAYEIGKYLWDNFATARKAMRITVTAMKNGGERIKFVFKALGAYIKWAFKRAFDAIRNHYATLLEYVAKGFDLIGGDAMAARLRKVVDAIRPARDAGVQLGQDIAEAYTYMTNAIEANNRELAKALEADEKEFAAKGKVKRQVDATSLSLGKLSKQNRTSAKAAREAAKAAEEQQRAYRDLLREINPLQAASDDYAAKLAILQKELDAGRITAKEYEEQVWALDQKMLGFGDDAEDTADKVAKAADPMADAWKRATERIDQSFADAFKGGFKSFKDFAGNIKNALRDLLAELAYQLAKSKFFQLLGGLSGRGGFLGGLGSLVPSGAFAAGEVGGLPGGGLPGGVPGMSGVLGTQIGATTLGGTMLAAGGGYLVGGFLEDRLGGNAQIGTTLGSTAGMIIGGPLGAVVGGALGGLVGSMFGGKWKTRDSGVELSYSGGELTGQQYEYQKKRNLFGSKTRTRHSELDSKVQAALNQTFDAIEQGVQQIADNLGRDVQDAIDSFTAEGKISLKGLSKEAAQAKLQEWVNRTGGQLMAAVLPEFSGIIRAAGDRAGELLQPLLSLSQYIGEDWAPHVATTLTGAARQAREAVERQLADYDGSVEATQRLAQAVQARYQVEQELLRQIGQVRESVKGMTDDLLADLGRALRSDQEQFDWLTQQRLLLRQQLEAASDPEEIQRLTAKVLSVTREQMQMMSAEQLKANAENITAFVRQVRTIAEDKLRQAEEVVKTEHQEIAGATRATLQSASQSIAEAARNMNQAAANLNVAAASMNNAAGAHIQAANVQTQILAWNWNGYDSGF